MSEIDKLMTQLNHLDDLIASCIMEFERRLATKITVSVDVEFQDGKLSWMKMNSQWHVVYVENGMATALQSTSRLMRMEAVRTGFPALLDAIDETLRNNIAERHDALEAFDHLRRKLDLVLGGA